MKELDPSQLPDYLRSRRWFAGKNLSIKEVTILDHVRLPVPGQESEEFALAVVEVHYEMGNPQRFLLTVHRGSDGQISDALGEDACARALFHLICDQVEVQSVGGVIRGERISGSQRFFDSLSAPESVARPTEDQSNTSLIFGDQMILKVIRKLEPGVNPEVEMGRFLSERQHSPIIPRLFGALHLEGPLNSTLAIVHQYIHAQSDGWHYVLEVARRSGHAEPTFLAEVNQLGRTVAQLHLLLSSEPSNSNFAPEPIQQADLQRWSASIIGELGVTIAAASRLLPGLDERRDALVTRAKAMASLAPSGQKIRLHGDLHLGQVLRTGKDWQIFDFEGEPSRTFSQRREKFSPLKDVAGMLRSFAYAAAVAEQQGGSLKNQLELWRKEFLAGYLDSMAGKDLLPSLPGAVSTLLDVFELEKTLYEVRYELQNRPNWIHIPGRALTGA